MNFRQFHILEMTIRSNDFLCNSALPDGGPSRPETCKSSYKVKHYCDYNEVCALYWFTLEQHTVFSVNADHSNVTIRQDRL